MLADYDKKNLRINKTRKYLMDALIELLSHCGLGRITVSDICEQAQVSRPTFYAYFRDKYDLLDFWLESIFVRIKILMDRDADYERIESEINLIMDFYKGPAANLLKNTDDETLERLYAFVLSILDVLSEKRKVEKLSKEYIILSNFCAGGILSLMRRTIPNVDQDFKLSSVQFHDMLHYVLGWAVE